ncbi:CBS domain-containing protein [Streptomyces sp. NPDC017056]|uniref:CBS domain-containing protein n=1 Tax=Streptomyces sp. NPDC017056 TaxID=3364973 RepID=UPI0037BC0ECE
MTLVQLVQMQTRPADAHPVHRKAVEAMDAAGPQVWDDMSPQVWDDMSVEVALSVMAAARTGRLVVCDQDSQCTARVTQRELTAVRNSSAYTDRVRLRDVLGVHAPFAAP